MTGAAPALRVLAVTSMYPPHYLGGYELACQDVVEGLRARGHDVSVLTTRTRVAGVEDVPGERDTGVWRDLEWYWDDHVLLSPPVHRRWQLERRNQAALARALEAARPDVVSAWSMGAMSLGLLTAVIERGLPLVCMVCDDWMLYGPKVDAWMRLFTGRPRLAAVAGRLAGVPSRLPELGAHATHCFVSRSTRSRAVSRSGWRLERATVVYGGVDTSALRAAATEPAEWRWRLLYAGRIDGRKGIDTVIRSLNDLPPEATVRVQGRGDDDELARLHRVASGAGVADRVSFGVCSRDELPAVYAAADVVVFPSTWEEPFGMVPIEAMASRRPVVATAVGGSAEFLADGVNCLRFEPGDSAALAAAVTRLAGDPDLRAALVRGGDATADELSLERYVDIVEAWHIAAAQGFPHGLPEDRALPAPPSDSKRALGP